MESADTGKSTRGGRQARLGRTTSGDKAISSHRPTDIYARVYPTTKRRSLDSSSTEVVQGGSGDVRSRLQRRLVRVRTVGAHPTSSKVTQLAGLKTTKSIFGRESSRKKNLKASPGKIIIPKRSTMAANGAPPIATPPKVLDKRPPCRGPPLASSRTLLGHGMTASPAPRLTSIPAPTTVTTPTALTPDNIDAIATQVAERITSQLEAKINNIVERVVDEAVKHIEEKYQRRLGELQRDHERQLHNIRNV